MNHQEMYEFYERLGLLIGMGWGFVFALVILIGCLWSALRRAEKRGEESGQKFWLRDNVIYDGRSIRLTPEAEERALQYWRGRRL